MLHPHPLSLSAVRIYPRRFQLLDLTGLAQMGLLACKSLRWRSTCAANVADEIYAYASGTVVGEVAEEAEGAEVAVEFFF